MVDIPRKTYPELTALTAPVVDGDVLAMYRSPGPLRRTTASTLLTYTKAPFAVTTPASQGAALVGFDQGLTIAAPMVIRDATKSGPLYASRIGLVGGSSGAASANVTKLQSALNDVDGLKNLIFDVDELYLDGNINVPVGVDQCVDIVGLGWNGPAVFFTGSGVTTGFTFTGTNYDYTGGVYDMNIAGTSGAVRAVTFSYLNHPRAERNLIRQFAGAGLYVYGSLMGHTAKNLLVSCGSLTECAIVVSGVDDNLVGAVSTHYVSFHDRISGSLAGGATGKKGGIGIDRTSVVSIISSQIESTATPIVIGGETSSVRGVSVAHIFDVGLENPGNNLPYIDVGQGWAGSAGGAVDRLRIESASGSPSGTTSALYGARFKNTTGVSIGPSVSLGLSGATSVFEFEGTGNVRYTIDPNPASFGDSFPWVRVNGTQAANASPLSAYYSDQVGQAVGSKTISGAIADLSPFAAQGGLYTIGEVTNGGATTMNTLTPWVANAIITLSASNSNTTIAHLAGGTGQFDLTAGANLAMVQDRPYQFIALASTGRWHQIG